MQKIIVIFVDRYPEIQKLCDQAIREVEKIKKALEGAGTPTKAK